MNTYSGFAEVYDMFMDDVPYDEWAGYVIGLLKKYGIHDGLVLELGCGTGSMTGRLAAAGYEMIGVDSSQEMLTIAGAKHAGQDILFLHQDMREFELYGTVKAAFCVGDCMNYLLAEEDLLQVFRLVNNYLDPGGYFIFDMDTIHMYESIGDRDICENRQEGSFIWENQYDPEFRMNQYDLTIFVQEADNLYRKYEECHVKRGYSPERIKELLEEAGLVCVAVYDAFTEETVKSESTRVYFIAKETEKLRGVK